MQSKIIISESSENTKLIAKKIAKNIKQKRVISLEGNLGSGKTTFIQGFAKALGIKEKIKSPTFVIMKKYKIPLKANKNVDKYSYIYHFDCYRIQSTKEIVTLGWEKIIQDQKNIILVEWGDKIKSILPKDKIYINFKFKKENIRQITIL